MYIYIYIYIYVYIYIYTRICLIGLKRIICRCVGIFFRGFYGPSKLGFTGTASEVPNIEDIGSWLQAQPSNIQAQGFRV